MLEDSSLITLALVTLVVMVTYTAAMSAIVILKRYRKVGHNEEFLSILYSIVTGS